MFKHNKATIEIKPAIFGYSAEIHFQKHDPTKGWEAETEIIVAENLGSLLHRIKTVLRIHLEEGIYENPLKG